MNKQSKKGGKNEVIKNKANCDKKDHSNIAVTSMPSKISKKGSLNTFLKRLPG